MGKRFGKLTKADAAKQKMEDFEFAMFEIRMKDANLPLSSNTLWSMGGRKMASGLTADCIDPTNGWYPDYKGQTTHLDQNKYIAMARAICFVVCLPGWVRQWTDLPDLCVLHVEALNAGKAFDYNMIQLPKDYKKRCPDFTLKFVLDKFGLGWARRLIPANDWDGDLKSVS